MLNKLRQKVERKTSQAVSGQVVGNKPHGPYGATLSLLAAYDVGRLLNQLSWNLQHAALLGKPEHYDQADAILIELQTQFRVFLLFQNFTERTAKEEHQKWRQFHGSEAHAEMLFRLNEEIQWCMNDGSTLEDARKAVLADKNWLPTWKLIREDVLYMLVARDELKLAFDLGEYIDGLLRPADAYAFLYDDAGEEGVADWCSDQCFLANHSRLEGEIEPEENWRQHLQCLWDEARIPHPLPPLPDDATLSNEQLRELWAQIEDAAIKGLKALDEAKVMPNCEFATNGGSDLNEQSSESRRGQLRLSADIDSETVTVNGNKQYQVSVAEAVFLAELIKKNGVFVPFRELQQKNEQLQGARPTRLIKSLEKKLRESFVEGRTGAGYRLTSKAWFS
jgi:hypothetical protein